MKIFKPLIQASATFLYVGYLPVFPGTWASLATVLLVFWLKPLSVLWIFLLILALISIFGVYLSGKYDQIFKTKDASAIVIDEVAGQMVALSPLILTGSKSMLFYLLALTLFRFFDIVKPLGINQVQSLPSGWGIMGDDILAGFYSQLIMWVVLIYG